MASKPGLEGDVDIHRRDEGGRGERLGSRSRVLRSSARLEPEGMLDAWYEGQRAPCHQSWEPVTEVSRPRVSLTTARHHKGVFKQAGGMTTFVFQKAVLAARVCWIWGSGGRLGAVPGPGTM